MTEGEPEITYEYTVEKRMVAVREGGALLRAAVYDGDGNRIFIVSRKKWRQQRIPEVSKILDDTLEDAKPGRTLKGKTTQYVKPGSYEQTSKDFDNFNPKNVTEINTTFGAGKIGTLSDGRKITARPGSSD